MPRLRATQQYRNQNLSFKEGDEFDVDDATALFLRTDSPGTFVPAEKPVEQKRVVVVDDETADLELTNVAGIGDARAESLAEIGIDSVIKLANADVDDVAEKLELSPNTIKRWQSAARKLIEQPRAK